MKFSKTFTNKLVTYTDRYFTWDKRTMEREGTDKCFDFFAYRTEEDGSQTVVCIDRTSFGLFAYIKKGNKCIYSEHFKTYKEVSAFKVMIRCLG